MEAHPATKSCLPESVGNYGVTYHRQVLELWTMARLPMPVRPLRFRYRCIDNRLFLQWMANNNATNMK